jgi:hypothetical protein
VDCGGAVCTACAPAANATAAAEAANEAATAAAEAQDAAGDAEADAACDETDQVKMASGEMASASASCQSFMKRKRVTPKMSAQQIEQRVSPAAARAGGGAPDIVGSAGPPAGGQNLTAASKTYHEHCDPEYYYSTAQGCARAPGQEGPLGPLGQLARRFLRKLGLLTPWPRLIAFALCWTVGPPKATHGSTCGLDKSKLI